MLHKLPLYFKCFFSNKENKKVVFTYKIAATENGQYPFQLLKLSNVTGVGWQSLSIYATVDDSLAILLRELFNEELSDEIYHGQAFVDPRAIMDKLNNGDRLISIYDETNAEAFRLEYDIAFEDLIVHKRKRLMRRPERR